MSDDLSILAGMITPDPVQGVPASFDTGTVTAVIDPSHLKVDLGDKKVTVYVPATSAGTAKVDSAVRVSVQENTYVLDSVIDGASGGAVPVGSVVIWMTATIPTGWLKLDGATYSSATYPALFAAIGTTTLPDMRDRFPIGTSATKAVTTTGGASTVTLTEANLASHDHTITHTHTMAHTHEFDHQHDMEHQHKIPGRINADDNNHTNTGNFATGDTGTVHDVTTINPPQDYSGGARYVTGRPLLPGAGPGGTIETTTSGSSAANTGASSAANTGLAGSGTAVTVLNPYLSLNFIIKAE